MEKGEPFEAILDTRINKAPRSGKETTSISVTILKVSYHIVHFKDVLLAQHRCRHCRVTRIGECELAP